MRKLISSRSLVVHVPINLFLAGVPRWGSDCRTNLLDPESGCDPESPTERSALGSEFNALNRGMHPRPSTGKCRGVVHDYFVTALNHPDEKGDLCAGAATDASSYPLSVAASMPCRRPWPVALQPAANVTL